MRWLLTAAVAVVASLVLALSAAQLLLAGVLASDAPPRPVAGSKTVGSVTLFRCDDPDATSAGAVCGTVPVPIDHQRGRGTLAIGFEWYGAVGSPAGTTVVVEGGPGWSTTAGRDGFLDLFYPHSDRNLLLVDLRGTGTSGPLNCAELERYFAGEADDYYGAVGECGRQLDRTWASSNGTYLPGSELFTTANAARDLAIVLDRLGLDRVDLFGTSYGTYFATTFAARFPDRLRSLTLDSAYEVMDLDPWFATSVSAAATAFDQVCRRAAGCAQVAPASSWSRIGRLATRLRAKPVEGTVTGPDGVVDVTVDAGTLVGLINSAPVDPIIFRELDAAARAYLGNRDSVPLLRLAAASGGFGGSDDVRDFSSGLNTAVICSDYPQLFDVQVGTRARERQLDDAFDGLDEKTFAPFTVDEWTGYSGDPYTDCVQWPAPDVDDPPLSEPRSPLLPGSVPALVLSGGLDSLTPPAGGQRVAEQLGPSTRWVELENTAHGTVLWDEPDCASTLVLRFIEQPDKLFELDASCAETRPEVHAVGSFPRLLADALPAEPGKGNEVNDVGLRLASVATATVGDAIGQYWYVYDRGTGLRGGTFTIEEATNVEFTLDGSRFTADAPVDGTASWDPVTGNVAAQVRMPAPGGGAAEFLIIWNDRARHGVARVTGTVAGVNIDATLPAP